MPEKLISHPALLLFLVFLHSFPSNHQQVSSLYIQMFYRMKCYGEGVHLKNAGEMNNNPILLLL